MSEIAEKSDNAYDETPASAAIRASQLEDRPEGYFPVTPEEKSMNRKVNRKLDIFILPVLSLMYLFSGLDRGSLPVVER
jgi:hypothetical protein